MRKNMTGSWLKRSTFLASVSLIALAPGLSLAQTAVPKSTDAKKDEDVIVVTAQKRSQKLQDVPISIEVIDTKKLDQLNISNFNEYAAMLPSVSFQTSQPGQTNVYMRGVASGGDGNHSGPLPSVGTYLDEQPVTTIGGALDVHIYDVARIESLAGPQGTLYGASSEAGTIRIITNKPDFSSSYGRIDVEANQVTSGGTGGKLEGMYNAPINEHAAARFVGWAEHDAGYISNVAGTRDFIGGISVNNAPYIKKNYNNIDVVGGRAALKVDLSDSWTATASILAQDQKNHGNFGSEPSVGDLEVQHFAPEYDHDRFYQAALTVQGKIGNFDLTYAGAYMHRKMDTSSDYSDYAEAYDKAYASYGGIAGYQYFTDAAGHTISSVQRIIGIDVFDKTSHEIRLASPSEDRFHYVVGLFEQTQTHLIHQDYQVANLAPNMSVNGDPGTLWLTEQKRVDRDLAAFGEAYLDITDKLTATVGARAFNYDNSLIGFFGFGHDFNGPPFNAVGSSRTGVGGCYTANGLTVRDNYLAGVSSPLLPASLDGSPCTNLGTLNGTSISPKVAKGDGSTYKFNLNYKLTPDVNVYGTVSKGFRPGGINRRSNIAAYAPDYLTNNELGLKSTLFDRKLTLNTAIYSQYWSKFQFAYLGANSFTEVHNGPDARINGLEFDANYRPIKHFIIQLNGAYTDARTVKNLCAYDDPTFACTNIDASTGNQNYLEAAKGTRLPITPQTKMSGSVRYEWETGIYKPFAQAVVSYKSAASSDLRAKSIVGGVTLDPAAELGDIPASTTLDASIGVDWKTFSAELFVSNLTNMRAENSRYVECSICYQRSYMVLTPPTTISLRLGTKF